MMKRKTILKLNKIFSLGYVPNRGLEEYTISHPQHQDFFGMPLHYGNFVNCFEHACFNLTNKQILESKIDYEDSICFTQFVTGKNASDEDIANRMFSFVEKTGLRVEECDINAQLKSNQWKVALYLCKMPDFRDFHFFLQEKDKRWSSKYAFRSETFEVTPYLPKTYVAPIYHDEYYFYQTYKLENPFAK